MASPLTTTAERWDVDLGGRTVLMLTIDYWITLLLHGEVTYDGSIVLESQFTFRAEGA